MKTTTRKKPAPMSRKRKADDPAQYERFREFAREHGADGEQEAFDQKFRKIVPPKVPSTE
jgi:hypothetical protein